MSTTQRIRFPLGVMIFLFTHALAFAQQPTGTHNEEYYLFRGNYPDNQGAPWGNDDALTNGITHDASNWYVTALSTDCLGRPAGSWGIWRVKILHARACGLVNQDVDYR